MKVLINEMSHEAVVDQLMKDLATSHRRFSQDRSFDFSVVRLDRFIVPTCTEEYFDDACMVYNAYENVQAPSVLVRQALLRRNRKFDEHNALDYAVVLYRSGDFKLNACFGARIYCRQTHVTRGELRYHTIDVRESGIGRDAPTCTQIPSSIVGEIGDADPFTLGWILSHATKKLEVECLCPSDVYGISQLLRQFEEYRAVEEVLARHGKGVSDYYRPLVRMGWANATFVQGVRTSPYGGAGAHVEALYNGLARNKVV